MEEDAADSPLSKRSSVGRRTKEPRVSQAILAFRHKQWGWGGGGGGGGMMMVHMAVIDTQETHFRTVLSPRASMPAFS